MGAPYSKDLRLRVLSAVDGGMSKMKAHQTFGVSRWTIDDWLKRRQETGDVVALTGYRRGVAPMISDLEAFADFAQLHSGATLGQMSQAWQEQSGQNLSINTFSLALKRLGWTRKKRAFSSKSATRTSAASSRGS